MTASPETLTDCLCPSDCGCHPHNGRANVCGCRGHEARAPRFYRVERGWVRYDERHGHAVHVRDDRDRTPEHAMYPRGYDSRCGWCWHGYTHSEAEHAHRLGAVTAMPFLSVHDYPTPGAALSAASREAGSRLMAEDRPTA